MEVVGQVGIFESQKACRPLSRHLLGRARFAQWWFIAIMLVGDLAASTLMEMVAPGCGWLAVILFTVGTLFLWSRYARTLLPKAWMARGVPANSTATYRVEAEGLVIAGGNSETRLFWPGISQIAPGNESWLLIGPGLAYFLPKRFFADQAAERAFLAACFEKLTPEAQTRSGEIAALVGSEAEPGNGARP